MKRLHTFAAAITGAIALSASIGTVAVSAAPASSTPVLAFDDAAQQVTLTIPTPACAPGHEGCQWLLFVNEPGVSGRPEVGEATGTTGVLTVHYPANFCGTLQADAQTGPPWTQEHGGVHTVENGNCAPTTTTTTTTSPPTTPPTVLPVNTPQAPPGPPSSPTVAAGATTPTAAPSGTALATGTVAAASTEPTTVPPAALGASGRTPTQLPFTGADIRPYVLVGLTLIALGTFLLIGGTSRRKKASSSSAG
jgi:hypothetical protein